MAAENTDSTRGATTAVSSHQWAVMAEGAIQGDQEPREDEPLLQNRLAAGDPVDDLESLQRESNRADQPALEAPDEATWTPPPSFMWMEIAIMANVFLYGFDGTVTASTYAVISSEFDAANEASWLTTSYLITSAACQPLYGRISDIFGRRMCFFISSIVFSVGCLGCGIAPTAYVLYAMRSLAGIGGAGLMTMGEFLDQRRPGKYGNLLITFLH